MSAIAANSKPAAAGAAITMRASMRRSLIVMSSMSALYGMPISSSSFSTKPRDASFSFSNSACICGLEGSRPAAFSGLMNRTRCGGARSAQAVLAQSAATSAVCLAIVSCSLYVQC